MAEINHYKVKIKSKKSEKTFVCKEGCTIKEVFNQNGWDIDAPCGGKCLCGKCKVKVAEGNVSEAQEDELQYLSHKERAEGIRLACCTKVYGNLELIVEEKKEAQIMSTGIMSRTEVCPYIRKEYLTLEPPTIEDQRADVSRILDKLCGRHLKISLDLLRRLSGLIREANYSLTLTYNQSTVLAIEAGDTTESLYGIAIDIGTTTIVAYLIDLHSGRQMDVISDLNAQRSFGSDVISRINHVLQDEDGLRQLNQSIIMQINEMIDGLVERTGIDRQHIYHIVVVGNSTMIHLAARITPVNIATAPFVPVITDKYITEAGELGITLNQHAAVTLVSCASGYVGADIIAAVLASGMLDNKELSLLIDIGTNGEIVLGNSERQVCCSTAAGPAFEGANIRNGVGGITGAINAVSVDGNTIKYSTIFDEAPLGICGSGIVDSIALLVESGIVDETGRFLERNEVDSEIGQHLYDRVIDVDGVPGLILAEAAATKNGEAITITQKDVREVQLAKAAIAAGIHVLLKQMNKTVEDITRIYLAGGFGSYMDKQSAVKIGLLPKASEDKITVLGNAAGTGAVMCLVSETNYRKSDEIKKGMEYVELSGNLDFQDEYVDYMFF